MSNLRPVFRAALLAAPLALAACAPAAVPEGRDDRATLRDERPEAEAQRSLDTLRAASRTRVSLDVAHGVPSAVQMLVPVGDGDPVEAAFGFLEAYAPLYRLVAPRAELHPLSARPFGERSTVVRFVQRTGADRGDLPVFNAGVSVYLDAGSVFYTSARTLPDVAVAPVRLTADEALREAKFDRGLEAPTREGEAQLGVWVDWSQRAPVAHTVWRMTVTGKSEEGPAFWRVDLDAATGEVVHVANLAPSCDLDLDIMYGYHGTSISCWIFAETDDWFDEDGMLDEYDAALDHNGEGLAAFDEAHVVYDYYRTTFGQCSYDGDDNQVEFITHTTVDGFAAANGYCGNVAFTDGSVVRDIVGHEFAHLVDYHYEDLEYQGLSGALDESFADFFGAMLDGNWTIGEDSSLGILRDMADPPSGQPDHVQAALSGDGMGLRSTTTSFDDGNVHTNSGIPNKVAFLVTDGGAHNGFVIDGMGRSKAEQLYHVVHITLGGEATFTDARNLFVGVANLWAITGTHGFDTHDVCQIANAWASVGVAVTKADVDCDGIADGDDKDDDNDGVTDKTDNCVGVPNVSQSDLDGDEIGDACDDDLDGDGDPNDDDNCLTTPNSNQSDIDGDDVGDLCDDGDHDGILDVNDNCKFVANHDQQDTDHDNVGDACDLDKDGDTVPNGDDNCETTYNPDQADKDGDDVGDVCDNCLETPNPDQKDCDGDGIGTACEEGVLDALSCYDIPYAEIWAWVHPMDMVTLPHVSLDDVIRLPADYALQVTVAGTSDPWVVTDTFGNVVAKSEPVDGAKDLRSASFLPALAYHYVEDRERGERAGFATTYHLSMSPRAEAAEVRLTVEGVWR